MEQKVHDALVAKARKQKATEIEKSKMGLCLGILGALLLISPIILGINVLSHLLLSIGLVILYGLPEICQFCVRFWQPPKQCLQEQAYIRLCRIQPWDSEPYRTKQENSLKEFLVDTNSNTYVRDLLNDVQRGQQTKVKQRILFVAMSIILLMIWLSSSTSVIEYVYCIIALFGVCVIAFAYPLAKKFTRNYPPDDVARKIVEKKLKEIPKFPEEIKILNGFLEDYTPEPEDKWVI